MNELLDRLLSAMDDFMEARQELRQMRSEYTGYSPSYHLSSWIEAEENAKKELSSALEEYVDSSHSGSQGERREIEP